MLVNFQDFLVSRHLMTKLVARFILDGIENCQMRLASARYGQMDPSEFVAEVRERMGAVMWATK